MWCCVTRPIRLLAAAFLFLGAVVLGGCQSLNKGSFSAFKHSLNTKAHGYQIVADPTGTAPTKFVERFEVQPRRLCRFPWLVGPRQ